MPPKECNSIIEEITPRDCNVPPVFQGSKEEEVCKKLVTKLTEDELEEAANASYAYYTSTNKTEDYRTNMALKLTRRFLRAEKGNYEKALKRIQSSLEFRKQSNVNELRMVFHKGDSNKSSRDEIISEMNNQPMIIRGFDRENHAILLKYRRSSPNADKQSMISAHLYIFEKAIACTEHISCGQSEKIVLCLNYDNYSRANTPPISLAKELIGVFERNYPEQLAYLVFVDAPFLARTLWKIIKTFIDPETVTKIKFVSGDEQKKQVLGPLINTKQAVPWVLPGGELSPSFDVDAFLNETPFHFDYKG